MAQVFPVGLIKFLRTPFLQNMFGQLHLEVHLQGTPSGNCFCSMVFQQSFSKKWLFLFQSAITNMLEVPLSWRSLYVGDRNIE